MIAKPWASAKIDLDAVRHNYAVAKAAAPGARALAVIKANAYGHGLVRVARALAVGGADGLAVARCHEAMELREAGIQLPILVLEGFLDSQEVGWCGQHRLAATLHHDSQIAMLEDARVERPIRVWIKIDTGMHRLGFPAARARATYERLAACGNADPDITLMSHLANADDPHDPYSRYQRDLFVQTTEGLPGCRSLANSAGVIGWPETRFDCVRPGIMLYGCSPFAHGTGPELGLRPAMTLETRLIAVHRLRAGDPIGYGGTWRCPRDSRIGVAAIGYGDGYPRHAASGTPVLVRGRPARLVGRVSMDMISIDLSELPEADVGDPVVVWGQGLPVEELAARAGTIAYELLCKVTSRVDFQESGDGPGAARGGESRPG